MALLTKKLENGLWLAKPVEPKDKEKGFQLDEIYELIGCEIIELPRCMGELKGFHLAIDGNGKVVEKELNPLATVQYGAMGPKGAVYDYIAGDAMLVQILNPGMPDEKII